jgi:putative ABC transport system permease protein
LIQKFFFTRELRRYPFFFLLLGFTLLLGTLGLVSISIVAGQVKKQLENNALNLLTSDFVVSARRELFPAEQEKVFSILKEKPTYQVIDLYSMVTHVERKQTRLVELRGVEKEYPFYGEITVSAGTFSPAKFYVSRDLRALGY